MTTDAGSPRWPDLHAELDGLNRQVELLRARAAEAHESWVAADAILRATVQRRDEVAAQVRLAATTSTGTAPEPAIAPPSGPPAAPAAPAVPALAATAPTAAAAGPRPEASTRTVQNILFVLGGILLGTAAIVFTAVAWTTFGVEGRATILALVTLVALALPALALWRRLRATAETFAGVGLLLVVLDGWAAWSVNLFGVQQGSGTRYAGYVCAATAAVAFGYRAATRLVGPGFAGLVAAQPVLPLLLADLEPGVAGWSLVLSAIAVMNLAVIARHRARASSYDLALRTSAWILYSGALGLGGLFALGALIEPGAGLPAVWRGAGALLAATLTTVAAAALSRIGALHPLASGAVAVGLVVGASRVVAVADPDHVLVLIAAVVTAAAGLSVLLRAALPATWRPGVTVGTLITSGLFAVVVTGLALGGALHTWLKATSPETLASDTWFTWQLPVALVLATIGVSVAVPAPGRPIAVVAGLVLTVLAVPSSIELRWWAPPVLDLAVAALLAAAASRTNRSPALGRALPRSAAWGALALAVHAVPASLARPELTAATLTGLAVVGFALARITATTDPFGRGLAGTGLFAGLAAVPPAVYSWLVWAGLTDWWMWRITVATVLVPIVAVALLRDRPLARYGLAAALLSAGIWPDAAALSGDEPAGVYAGLGLVALAATLVALPRGRSAAGGRVLAALVVAIPAAVLLLVDVIAPVAVVVGLPYSWLGAVWSGVTGGLGLAPATFDLAAAETGSATYVDAVALALLSLASGLATYAVTRRIAPAIAGLAVGGPTAVLVALVAAAAPWPAVPAATLLIGLIGIVAVALSGGGPVRATIVTGQGVLYAGAGLAGLLALRWSTLTGLGLTVVAAAIVGGAGRSTGWRIAGWLAGTATALALAAAAGLAADLAAHTTSFAVLAVAILTLALGAALPGRGSQDSAALPARGSQDSAALQPSSRRIEAKAIESAAHGGAVVALLFTVGWAGYAASICTVWGVAVALRALWPGTGRTARAALAAVAAGFELLGWWLLLAARDVVLVEAYTLPLAGVALLAGWAALRARPDLRSWVAYGPALAAAFLPSLGTILTTAGEPWRRLGLGVAALAVVVIGATRRLRAPVLVGGGVLLVVAVHEIAVWWELLQGWIPLAVGGALLVGLAITYERRRRDLARLREALRRMT